MERVRKQKNGGCMRKNKRKWICILMLALLFCISAAAVTETRVQAAQTKETTGFVKKKGKTYYSKNGKKQKGLKRSMAANSISAK